MYLGSGGCLFNIPFRYQGWSKSVANPLIATILAKPLHAAHKPLYKQPSLFMPCENLSTLSIIVMQCMT